MSSDPTSASTGAPRPMCQNCGAPLMGEHCYACGQPVKGLVRHFTSILGDFLDSVLNIDARVFRTLWPLFAKPGYLSIEYFRGHRIRFVSPVRLFVFLSIVTFFVAQLMVDWSGMKLSGGNGGDDQIASARTVQEVKKRRDVALAELNKARRDTKDTPGVSIGLDAASTAIKTQADRRIAVLEAAAKAGKPPPPPGEQGEGDVEGDSDISFNDKGPWDAKKNPIHIDWLPDAANRKLNDTVGHARDNIRRGERDPNLFKDAALSTVPTTLFVMLPLFALMLKIVYAFKRRLYMEHLIVALHSHAFLCLALLGMFLLMGIGDAVGPKGPLHSFVKLAEVALWIWMPLYLLIMQKRVYGQGWIMTVLKYCVLGLCYSVLLAIGATFTMLAGIVWM
jgi:hypothetical protein